MLGLWYGELADRKVVGVMTMQLTGLTMSKDGQESYTDECGLQHLEQRRSGPHGR